MSQSYISEIQHSAALAIDYVLLAHKHADGNGFAHSVFYFKHIPLYWNKPYPETSGYIVETLSLYLDRFPEKNLKQVCKSSVNWLLRIQHSDGWFPSGYANSEKASVFNTAQILFGLLAYYKITKDEQVYLSIQKACLWLQYELEQHNWEQFAYVENFIPSYYSRVLWPYVLACRFLNIANEYSSFYTLLKQRIDASGYILQAGFYPNKEVLTHSFAYALEGYIALAELESDPELLTTCRQTAEHCINVCKDQYPGYISSVWKADYSFECLTGTIQLAICYLKLYKLTRQELYKTEALRIFKHVQSCQIKKGKLAGAFPSSNPVYGTYFPFRAVNWTNKFFLDLCLLIDESNLDPKSI